MQSDLLLLKRMLLTIVTFTGIALTSQGQIPLTIDKAMEIAQENSPSLRRSYMNLERYKQNLLAQKASLKSRFSLNLNPVDYNKNRRFDNRLSQWYTYRNIQYQRDLSGRSAHSMDRRYYFFNQPFRLAGQQFHYRRR